MPRNINEPMEREQDRSDECSEPITLICSFPQRKDLPDDEYESNEDKNDGDPTKLGPQPEPIALGMNRAAVAVRSGPKNCKDVFKITETDSGPGRVANQLKDIRKDPPPEIG